MLKKPVSRLVTSHEKMELAKKQPASPQAPNNGHHDSAEKKKLAAHKAHHRLSEVMNTLPVSLFTCVAGQLPSAVAGAWSLGYLHALCINVPTLPPDPSNYFVFASTGPCPEPQTPCTPCTP